MARLGKEAKPEILVGYNSKSWAKIESLEVDMFSAKSLSLIVHKLGVELWYPGTSSTLKWCAIFSRVTNPL